MLIFIVRKGTRLILLPASVWLRSFEWEKHQDVRTMIKVYTSRPNGLEWRFAWSWSDWEEFVKNLELSCSICVAKKARKYLHCQSFLRGPIHFQLWVRLTWKLLIIRFSLGFCVSLTHLFVNLAHIPGHSDPETGQAPRDPNTGQLWPGIRVKSDPGVFRVKWVGFETLHAGNTVWKGLR